MRHFTDEEILSYLKKNRIVGQKWQTRTLKLNALFLGLWLVSLVVSYFYPPMFILSFVFLASCFLLSILTGVMLLSSEKRERNAHTLRILSLLQRNLE
jgi:hypothetical protein